MYGRLACDISGSSGTPKSAPTTPRTPRSYRGHRLSARRLCGLHQVVEQVGHELVADAAEHRVVPAVHLLQWVAQQRVQLALSAAVEASRPVDRADPILPHDRAHMDVAG